MTIKAEQKVPRASGTRYDFPANSPHARCQLCLQPRTPLFQATPETHNITPAVAVCARCWSANHVDLADLCPHCGKDTTEDPLW